MRNILIFKNKGCYGCGVCVVVCPKKIIGLKLNKDGFYEPYIDNLDACVNCGICLDVCSFNHDEVIEQKDVNIGYAVFSNNSETRLHSTSGGFAYEITKTFIEKGYDACVVKYNYSQNRAEHFIADSLETLQLSQGSKYIQSYTIDGFSPILKDRKRKHIVIGTPCQIDSLRRLIRLKNIENNFLLIDFYCHGVPSYLMWNKYLDFARKKVGNINKIIWRSKVKGWQNSTTMNICGEKDEFFSSFIKGDYFFKFFLGNRCLGKACYDACKFKRKCASDIRMGDFWGQKFVHCQDGVSAVKINSVRGAEAFKNLEKSVYFNKVQTELIEQGQIKEAVSRPLSYNIVSLLLKRKLSIKIISKIAFFIEFPIFFKKNTEYYIIRLLSKLKELCKLKR